MAIGNDDDPSTGAPLPWVAGAVGNSQTGLSTTADDGITNQQINKIALDLSSQGGDVVAALAAITAAINAKPAA